MKKIWSLDLDKDENIDFFHLIDQFQFKVYGSITSTNRGIHGLNLFGSNFIYHYELFIAYPHSIRLMPPSNENKILNK